MIKTPFHKCYFNKQYKQNNISDEYTLKNKQYINCIKNCTSLALMMQVSY